MSQVPGQPAADLEYGKEKDGDLELSQPELKLAPNQSPQSPEGGSSPADTQEPILTMYSEIPNQEEDTKIAERWKTQADALLTFIGIFSAVVAAFLVLSIPDLIPNSQDINTFYLQNIYQLQVLAASNISVPSTVAAPPKFSPSKKVICVNVLWSLSLGASLSCALMATMIQQWARRYISFTQSPDLTPIWRARMSASFYGSIDKLFIESLDTLLPSFLHVSLLLFVIGFLIFIININHVVFFFILPLFVFIVIVYSYITVLPLSRLGTILYTPLFTYPTSILVIMFCTVLRSFSDRLWSLFESPFKYVDNKAKTSALAPSLTTGVHILQETLKSRGNDDDLEKFFEAIPGFRDFKVDRHVNSYLLEKVDKFRTNLGEALVGFLDRTFSSASISEVVKNDRISICLNASRAALDPKGLSRVLYTILDRRWREALQWTQARDSPSHWDNRRLSSYLQGVVTRIVARVHELGDCWILLVKGELLLPELVLPNNITDDDSVSLAIWILVTRQLFQANSLSWDSNLLRTLPHFDIRNAVPGLQHEFCALWNEIVLEAMSELNNARPIAILRDLRDAYNALHPDTDGVTTSSSYPSCNIAGHRPDSTTDGPHPHA
ncbi:hypothetical protein BJV74DRAFT_989732 [Russula compacta]|nr:hypothetical protein BJV74DRAFT_989732 [Russula compacta]